MSSISLILLTRILHVIAGLLWAGIVFVLVAAVMPIGKRYAQEGAERWMSMISLRMGPLIGLTSLLTVLSGGYLLAALHPGNDTSAGLVLQVGALAGVLALILGAAVVRPLMAKLANSPAQSNDPQARAAHEQLRRRTTVMLHIAATLVAIAVVCMALFRYVPMLS